MSVYVLTNIRLISRPPCKNVANSAPYFNQRYATPALTVNRGRYSTKTNTFIGWATWKGVLKSFVPVGVCLVAVMQWRAYRKRMSERTANKLEIHAYRVLPLRIVSRWWGWIADKNLPESLRPLVYGLYASTFGVNLAEAVTDDFRSYKSLSDFFARSLKDGVRTVDESSCLVSPCDGTVLHLGTVDTGHVEQVKGVTYSLENFLGENTWNKTNGSACDYRTSLLHKFEHNHTLYQCVIYLAPGDYHRFHSPTEWNVTHRRHFHGELLSVNPTVAQWLPGLFCLNERALYLGHWKHGFFSFTAVGATNVGTVKVYFDKTLQTNRPKAAYKLKDICLGSNMFLKRGDPIGEFRMGSTIVLVFEGPPHFQFTIKPGQKVRMGQSVGCSAEETHVDRIEKMKSSTVTNAS